jgi:hypothetical protein
MAVAHPPLVKREREMISAPQNVVAVDSKKPINPVLVAFLIAMAIFPFIVGYLPAPMREYLGALFR